MRKDNRDNLSLRKIEIIPNFIKNSEGSCLVKFGETQVVCTASVDSKVPRWLVGSGKGWVTAEYGMLPRSTHERMRREAAVGKIGGRTSEIQRLIGRSLRAVVDLGLLNEKLITIDCDVLTADGGTRTAAITGGFVALKLCIQHLLRNKEIKINPMQQYIAAVSCGIVEGKILLDLNYEEDSTAEIDANFVITENMQLVEIQATGERKTFSDQDLTEMLKISKSAIKEIIQHQKSCFEK
jgi:ribonuclease PH